jgi:hypothetical protein
MNYLDQIHASLTAHALEWHCEAGTQATTIFAGESNAPQVVEIGAWRGMAANHISFIRGKLTEKTWKAGLNLSRVAGELIP